MHSLRKGETKVMRNLPKSYLINHPHSSLGVKKHVSTPINAQLLCSKIQKSIKIMQREPHWLQLDINKSLNKNIREILYSGINP